MQIIYADQPPSVQPPSIFLAGPTPRNAEVKSWRISALRILQTANFPGAVLIPERQDWQTAFDYIDQVEWEYTCLEAATAILFWIPRDLATLPGFTTNVEFGRYVDSGRCVYGRPDDAPKNRYLDWLYQKCTGKVPYQTLEATIEAAIAQTLAP